MLINSQKIGQSAPCFIIAEMSANHNGSLDKAAKIIKKAKEAGADAIKLQTYKAETMTLDSNRKDFQIDEKSPWSQHKSMFNLYEKAYTPWEWQRKLFDIAKENNINIFSTPFDISAVDFLETLDCPAYKIASPEITDIPLIERIALTKKPVFISTGLATYQDLKLAVDTLKDKGSHHIAILKCTSSYPAPYNEINLKTLIDYKNEFDCIPGLSDHTLGDAVPIASVALGAKVIEKHFIIDNDEETADSFFSMNFHDFKKMVEKIRNVEQSIGEINYELTESMLENINSRRSLYVSEPIKKGDCITSNNIKSVRPAYGLHPKYYKKIIGKKVNRNLDIGDRLTFDYIED